MNRIFGSINKRINPDDLRGIKHLPMNSIDVANFAFSTSKILLGNGVGDSGETQANKDLLISDCGNYAMSFVGKVYNHRELQKKFSEVYFPNDLPIETVFRILQAKGIAGIADFVGSFVLSFLNLSDGKLFLARDAYGTKPFYWSNRNEEFVFASEIDLIAALNHDRSLEEAYLPLLLRLRYLPSPHTLFKNINRVLPGHIVEVNLNDSVISVQEKWIPNEPFKEIDKKHNATTQYGNLLQKAVERRMETEEEVGLLLSGGVDSAVIAALMQKECNHPIKAFTIGFEGDHSEDEIDAAATVAKILGLEHYSKKIGFDNFLSVLQKTVEIVNEPLATTSMIPMYFLSEMAAEKVNIVLSGQGADEPLGGYPKYRAEYISGKIPRSIFRIGEKALQYLPLKNEQVDRALKSLGEKEEISRFLKICSLFHQEEIASLLNKKESLAKELIAKTHRLYSSNKDTSTERMMAIDLRMNLSDDLMLYTHKITGYFGLECRIPYLDAELVSFLEALPLSKRLSFNKTKIIHKDFAKRLLPNQIINRKKIGFKSPTEVWFRRYSEQVKHLLLSPSTFTEIFDQTSIERILKDHNQGYNREKQIFLLLGIYYWLQFNDEVKR